MIWSHWLYDVLWDASLKLIVRIYSWGISRYWAYHLAFLIVLLCSCPHIDKSVKYVRRLDGNWSCLQCAKLLSKAFLLAFLLSNESVFNWLRNVILSARALSRAGRTVDVCNPLRNACTRSTNYSRIISLNFWSTTRKRFALYRCLSV